MHIGGLGNFLSLAEEIWAGARFLAKVPLHLRRPLRLRDAQDCLRRRLEARPDRFLSMVRRTIYARPTSPYRALLREAGCELGDLENLVHQEGIEGALKVLYRHGAYLTVEEFKGHRTVVRGSTRFTVQPRLLQNPTISSKLSVRTSGSRSPTTPVPIDLAYIRSRSVNAFLDISARGGLDWLHGVWGVPGGAAIGHILELSGYGAYPVRWFSCVDPKSPELHPRYRWSARAIRAVSLMAGAPLPRLQHVPIDDPMPVVRWFAQVIRSGKIPHLIGYVSSAVRLCLAAKEAGIEIPGVQFTTTGEPLTEMRRETIRRSGAEASPRYGSIECGSIGYGCLQPETSDEVHLLHDRLALIQVEEGEESEIIPADALLVTALEPATPYILLNVSLGDEAVISERKCGCPLQQLGWTTHLHSIRSYEKLTSEGMSFLDADLVRLLEETLPAHFGGGPIDYQLSEEEDEDGRPCLRLLVHPRVGPVDPQALTDAFLSMLGSGSEAAKVMELMWRDAGLLKVERRPPFVTSSGKVLHLYLKRRPGR